MKIEEYRKLEKTDYSEFVNELDRLFDVKYKEYEEKLKKDKLKPEEIRDELEEVCTLDGTGYVVSAFALIYLNNNPNIKTFDDFTDEPKYKETIEESIYVSPYGYAIFLEDTVIWEALLEMRGKFDDSILKACALFMKIDTMVNAIRTPSSISKLAVKLLEIDKNESIADFGTGEGSFFKEAVIQHPDNDYYLFDTCEDTTSVPFIRACLLDVVFNNQIVENCFEDNGKYFYKVFCDTGCYGGSGRKKQKEDYQIPERDPEYITVYSQSWSDALNTSLKTYANGKAIFVIQNVELDSPRDIEMREYMVARGLIEKVILLPERLYEGSNVKVSLLVCSHGNETVTFVDVRDVYTESRIKGKRFHILNEENIETIYNICNKETNISKQFTIDDIIENNSNLNPNQYINSFNYDNYIKLETVMKKVARGVQIKGSKLDENSVDYSKYKYLSLSNIQDGMIDDNALCIDVDFGRSLSKYEANINSLIISKNVKPFKSTIIKEEGIIISGNFYMIEVDEEKINPEFLQVYLQSKKGINAVLKECSTGVLPMISKSNVGNIMIPDISLKEQNKYVKEYNKLNDKIINKRDEINKLIDIRNRIIDGDI